MGKKLIFLADVHLSPAPAAEAAEARLPGQTGKRPARNTSSDAAGSPADRAEALFGFLQAVRGEAEALYILGDLFDYWVGPRQRRRPAWGAFLDRLGEIARGGPHLGVIGGNRDYLLDAAALAPYGIESLGLEHRFERDGLRFTLIHGHLQFPDRWASRLFLRWIQGRVMRWVAHAVPLWMALSVAEGLRCWRRLAVGRKDPKDAERYDPAAFLPFFEAGADVVVCGHNHFARDYTAELGRPGCRLFAVGPWDAGPSYLEYADGAFCLVDPRL